MAISTYSELKSALANWSDRDLGDRAAEFITLAESALNNQLDLREYVLNTTLTGTAGVRTIALPADFVAPQALFLTTYGYEEEIAAIVEGTYPRSDTNGTPSFWSVDGANISFDCPCDQAHTFRFQYRGKFALSDATPTNWLLTNHPDAYLFASLVELYSYTQSVEAASAWQMRLDRVLPQIDYTESRSASVAELRVDPGLMIRPSSFNIYRG